MVSRLADSGSEQRLLDTATEVFLQEGFSGARVEKVAEKAGVNKAMIYYHFRSKRGLYQAVLLRLFEGVLSEAERSSRKASDPRMQLVAFYAAVARIFAERPALPALMLREIIGGGDNMEAEIATVLAGILTFVERTVAAGVADGSIRPVHPLLVHLSMMAPLAVYHASGNVKARVLSKARPGAVPPTADELVEHLAVLIERGLEPLPTEPRNS
jgi:AcrR family transcriptional regulator